MIETFSPEVLAALKSALRRLRHSDRFRVELEASLQAQGFSADVVQDALEFLQRRRLLDDSRTLGLWLEMSERRGEGREKLRARLLAKGLAEEKVAEALSGWDEEQERERALATCRALRSGGASRERAFRRMVAKGFDTETAESAVRECFGDVETEEGFGG